MPNENLEQEILAEIQQFEPAMTAFLQRCDRIRELRERAKDKRVSPAVAGALGPAWGEVYRPAVESRLEALEKCIPLSPAGAEILQHVQRERQRVRAEEAERSRVVEVARAEAARLAKKPQPGRTESGEYVTQAFGIGDITHIPIEDYSRIDLTVTDNSR